MKDVKVNHFQLLREATERLVKATERFQVALKHEQQVVKSFHRK